MASEGAVGFIGLGWMGSHFAGRLLKAGLQLRVYDVAAEKMDGLVREGAEAAPSAGALIAGCDLVLLSLRNSDIAVQVMKDDLLPRASQGKIIVDLGTTRVPDTREMASAFAAKGAALLDCPVSGDPRTPVYMFCGGDREAFAKTRSVLEQLADPDHLTYGGESGAGQILKGVNQLAMGLVAGAWMETISFATRQGISAELVAKAVGGSGAFRAELTAQAKVLAAGKGENNDLKFAELPYFLAAAEAAGIDLPLTSALYHYCAAGEPKWRDNMNRPYVSFWNMLNRKNG